MLIIITPNVLGRISPRKKEKYKELGNFILTVIATFAGVCLAVALTVYYNDKADKDKAIKLLSMANVNLESSITSSLGYSPITIEKSGKSQQDSFMFLKENPPRYPELFRNVMNYEVVLNKISPTTYSVLTINESTLRSYYSSILSSRTEDEMLKNEAAYVGVLKSSEQIINVELKRMNDPINEQQLEEKLFDVSKNNKYSMEEFKKDIDEFNK